MQGTFLKTKDQLIDLNTLEPVELKGTESITPGEFCIIKYDGATMRLKSYRKLDKVGTLLGENIETSDDGTVSFETPRCDIGIYEFVNECEFEGDGPALLHYEMALKPRLMGASVV